MVTPGREVSKELILFWLIIGLEVKLLSCIELSFSLKDLSEKLEKIAWYRRARDSC